MKRKQFDDSSTRRLYAAIRSNNVNDLQSIYDEGYPIADARFGEMQSTALMMAVNRDNIQLAAVRKLIQLGSDPVAVDEENSNSLHIIASNPDVNPEVGAKIIEYIVRKAVSFSEAADPEKSRILQAKDGDGDIPYACALKNTNPASGANRAAREEGLFGKTITTVMKVLVYAREVFSQPSVPVSDRESLFNEAMESDENYVTMLNRINQMPAQQQKPTGGFAAKEDKRRAEAANKQANLSSNNPLQNPLVANEGGGYREQEKKNKDKKQDPCCTIM